MSKYTPESPKVVGMFAVGSPESQKLMRDIDGLIDKYGGYDNVLGSDFHQVFNKHFTAALNTVAEKELTETQSCAQAMGIHWKQHPKSDKVFISDRYICPDGDHVELEICENEEEALLHCFSGIPGGSHIHMDPLDWSLDRANGMTTNVFMAADSLLERIYPDQ